MLDSQMGLFTMSSWAPALDPADMMFYNTTAGDYLDDGGLNTSYWLYLVIKIGILCGWFSDRLKQYACLIREACSEAAEERRMMRAAAPSVSSSPAGEATTAPTTFPQFSRQPVELRQQIWAESLPGPRVLMLQHRHQYQQRTNTPIISIFILILILILTIKTPTRLATLQADLNYHHHHYQQQNVWSCTAPIPTALHVCAESRAVAQRHYRLGLAPGGASKSGTPSPRIYVDFSRDVIALDAAAVASAAGRNLWRLTRDVRCVRHLAVAALYASGSGGVEVQDGNGEQRGGVLSAGWFGADIGGRRRAGLDGVEDVAVVDSALFAAGIVPRVAQLDWAHWMRWQCGKGRARWAVGGGGGGGREGGWGWE
ncbi:hypothetical protein B0T24DRAFT_720542 [Lasiosphaeria ovina]|uniref:2EXR domain-containing protein n=1 Tax=Lasiosphaeria ovina TaxID=92902 RepID=A0AAE0N7V4_9PEZI|nr:hypothetical protein B0T24DRAFT_720542 [Lasiosphaeria ovina]